MLFWQLVGTSNIFFIEGEHWKRQSRKLKHVLQGPPPTSDLVALSKKTLRKIEEQSKPRPYSALEKSSANSKGVIIPWSELMHRFTLDVVGLLILGYDFQALDDPDSPFVNGYHASLDALTSPAYVFVPKLERIFPRRAVKEQMLSLRSKFREIIEYKRTHPGDDLISRLTEDKGSEIEEMVDNVVAMFIAGHVRQSSIALLTCCS
jgi:cytochrome P450